MSADVTFTTFPQRGVGRLGVGGHVGARQHAVARRHGHPRAHPRQRRDDRAGLDRCAIDHRAGADLRRRRRVGIRADHAGAQDLRPGADRHVVAHQQLGRHISMPRIRDELGAVQHVRAVADLDRGVAHRVERRVGGDVALEADQHRVAVADRHRRVDERRLLRRRRERHHRRIRMPRGQRDRGQLQGRHAPARAHQSAIFQALGREGTPPRSSPPVLHWVHQSTTVL